MTAQAQAMPMSKAAGAKRRDLLIAAFMLAVGIIVLLLARFGDQPVDRSIFTDEIVGTLFSLPSQATLYTIGVAITFSPI